MSVLLAVKNHATFAMHCVSNAMTNTAPPPKVVVVQVKEKNDWVTTDLLHLQPVVFEEKEENDWYATDLVQIPDIVNV